MQFWKEEYTLDVPIIDIQHMRLFSLIGQLDNYLEDESPALLEGLLEELRLYTHYHFETEEKLFKESGYTDEATHCEQHRMFAETVEGYYQIIKGGQLEAKLEACLFLQNWWVVHVQQIDRSYVPFISST